MPHPAFPNATWATAGEIMTERPAKRPSMAKMNRLAMFESLTQAVMQGNSRKRYARAMHR